MPENVTASEINSTSARLTWDAPSAQGTFSVSFYRVRLVPSPSDEVIETTMTETFVSGLLPGTEYNVTVAAVVNDTRLLSLEAEIESLSALFNTSVSGLKSVATCYFVWVFNAAWASSLHIHILL